MTMRGNMRGNMRRLMCGLALAVLAGCSAGQEVLTSVPLIGPSPPAASAHQTLKLEGAALTLPLKGWKVVLDNLSVTGPQPVS